jgi:hypothetical protein
VYAARPWPKSIFSSTALTRRRKQPVSERLCFAPDPGLAHGIGKKPGYASGVGTSRRVSMHIWGGIWPHFEDSHSFAKVLEKIYD